MKNIYKLIISIAICELAGIIGSFFTVSSVSTWYVDLQKPVLNPPSWVFGPVWITLYALMGVALFLIWKQHSNILENVRMLQIWKIGIVVFFIQLFLNALWSILFFGMQNPLFSLIEIVILWIAILLTIIVFYRISKPASYLLMPYILWVSFAMYLNYAIWVLN